MATLVNRKMAKAPRLESALLSGEAWHSHCAQLARILPKGQLVGFGERRRPLAVACSTRRVTAEEVQVQSIISALASRLQIRIVLFLVINPALVRALVDEESGTGQVVDRTLSRVEHKVDVVPSEGLVENLPLRIDDLVRDQVRFFLGAGEMEINVDSEVAREVLTANSLFRVLDGRVLNSALVGDEAPSASYGLRQRADCGGTGEAKRGQSYNKTLHDRSKIVSFGVADDDEQSRLLVINNAGSPAFYQQQISPCFPWLDAIYGC